MVCCCSDFRYRNEKCKHIFAVEVRQEVVIQPVNISDCIFCLCSVLKKYGIRYNKSGSIQRFLCTSCKRTFSINIGFEKMKHNPQADTTAMRRGIIEEPMNLFASSADVFFFPLYYKKVWPILLIYECLIYL
jgi:hypothetical protein